MTTVTSPHSFIHHLIRLSSPLITLETICQLCVQMDTVAITVYIHCGIFAFTCLIYVQDRSVSSHSLKTYVWYMRRPKRDREGHDKSAARAEGGRGSGQHARRPLTPTFSMDRHHFIGHRNLFRVETDPTTRPQEP